MKIKVTTENIENAVRKNSHHCMIADAVHEADPSAKFVKVDLQSIQWSDTVKGVRYTALTPKKAQKNLLAWDKGMNVQPFMFTIHPVSQKPIGWKANHPNSSRKGKRYKFTGKHRKYHVVPQREHGIEMFA